MDFWGSRWSRCMKWGLVSLPCLTIRHETPVNMMSETSRWYTTQSRPWSKPVDTTGVSKILPTEGVRDRVTPRVSCMNSFQNLIQSDYGILEDGQSIFHLLLQLSLRNIEYYSVAGGVFPCNYLLIFYILDCF